MRVTPFVLLLAGVASTEACSGVDSGRGDDSVALVHAADSLLGPSPPIPGSATWAVTARGLGPLRVGMTVAEARAAIGGALEAPDGADTAACDYVFLRGGPPGVSLMVGGGVLERIEVDSAIVATTEGARIGDSETRI